MAFYDYIRATGPFVVADFVSLASPYQTKLAHFIAPPLQRKPAALGFALGAAFGGLFVWKIAADAVSQPRLALPSRCLLVRCLRAGQCPAPTKKKERFRMRRRGGYQPPVSLPPKGEGAPVRTLGRMRGRVWVPPSPGCAVSPERGECKLPEKTENPRRSPREGRPARVCICERTGETLISAWSG